MVDLKPTWFSGRHRRVKTAAAADGERGGGRFWGTKQPKESGSSLKMSRKTLSSTHICNVTTITRISDRVHTQLLQSSLHWNTSKVFKSNTFSLLTRVGVAVGLHVHDELIWNICWDFENKFQTSSVSSHSTLAVSSGRKRPCRCDFY